MNEFISDISKRRSIYDLNKELPISKDELVSIVKDVIVQLPTAFHSQSTRIVILFDEQHKMLWEITKETLRKLVPPENFKSTNDKIDSFASGYGTILFFDDSGVTNQLAKDFPLYKDNFATWAQQSSGIAQFALWTALAQVKIGASLQHYNPLIDEEVKKTFAISEEYRLIAQMPFGGINHKADEKVNKPVDEMVFVKK